jgi:hypothetical protein
MSLWYMYIHIIHGFRAIKTRAGLEAQTLLTALIFHRIYQHSHILHGN